MKGYCVSCVFNCKPDKVEDMKKIINYVYAPSLQEKGCLEYRWYQSYEAPENFLLFMTWENKKAFEDHVNSAHVQGSHAGISDIPTLDEILTSAYQDLSWKYLPLKF